MTPERIAELRKRHNRGMIQADAVPELLDEIERVQKQRDTIIEVHNAYVEQERAYAERLARECLFSDSDKSVSEIIAAAKAKLAGEQA